MIKLLKLASYLSIALAVSTVVFAGIGITRENDTFSERADFLDKPTVIERLRELEIPKTDGDKTSPLVTQAIDFAYRINPPPPPPADPRLKGVRPTTSVAKKAAEKIYRPSTYKLVGTCRYEKYPEKSLALLDVTSKGLLWFHQGDMLGPSKIERIDDGSIVLLQGGIRKTMVVPKQNIVSSLLKGSGGNVKATISSPASTGSNTRPTGRTPSATSRMADYSSRRTIRKRPTRPTSEQARKAAEKDTTELRNILDGVSGKDELMKAVMKMLEAGSKRKTPKKDSSK